jgi:1,4-dihydroxy-2-naphthoate octaprenyltransferase
MTVISISVGSALAALNCTFSWGLYLLTLLGTVLMHAAANLVNDYYDVKSGVDTLEVSTAQYRPHPLVEGKLSFRHVAVAAGILYALSALIGIFLAAVCGWQLLAIGVIGAFASVTYTAPPFKYKYSALGEVSVFVMWGPLMVAAAYFVQCRMFSIQALWISLPFGLLVALVLLANNIRDISHDRSKGILTLAIVLGQRNGLLLFGLLVALAYLGIILMSLWGPLYLWSLLVLLSLPLALRLIRQMAKQVPADADARTAQLDTVFGLLLVISLVLSGVF